MDRRKGIGKEGRQEREEGKEKMKGGRQEREEGKKKGREKGVKGNVKKNRKGKTNHKSEQGLSLKNQISCQVCFLIINMIKQMFSSILYFCLLVH